MRRIVVAALAAMLGIGALTACGSTSSSTSGSAASATATGSPSAAKTPPGSPIVIGSICSCSGPQASSVGQVSKTLEGWAAWKNANGGIGGHPVKMVVLDDGGNATTSAKDAKQLVEQEKVVAIVGEMSIVDTAWTKYVEAKGVPVIGAAVYNTSFLTSPAFFPTGAQVPTLAYGLVNQAKQAGKSKIGVLPCAEAPACAQFSPLIAGIGGKVVGGVSVAYEAKVTVTQPSYTANCLSARSKGVDGMVVVENAATVMRVADQCAQQGYKPQQMNLSATVGRVWAKNANMDGAVAIEPNPPLADESIPATKQFHAALDTYAKGVSSSDEYNEDDLWAWAAAEAFSLAGKRAHLTPKSTPADVKRGLYTFRNETLGGLTPPLTYKPGPPGLVGCYFVTQVKGGAFTAPNGAKPTCLTPSAAQAMGAVLKAG
jgi:branched-chain amino acid transport system substrate-binding protein